MSLNSFDLIFSLINEFDLLLSLAMTVSPSVKPVCLPVFYRELIYCATFLLQLTGVPNFFVVCYFYNIICLKRGYVE